jgi:hypothetical protein
MLGDPGTREAGTFRQPGSRSAVRDHLLGGSARPGKSCFGDAGRDYPGTFTVVVGGGSVKKMMMIIITTLSYYQSSSSRPGVVGSPFRCHMAIS